MELFRHAEPLPGRPRYFKFGDGEVILSLLDEDGRIWRAVPLRIVEMREVNHDGQHYSWPQYDLSAEIWDSAS